VSSPPDLGFRPARPADVARLTEIAHRAKAHWGYPPDLLELWRGDLTYTVESLAADQVWVAERAGDWRRRPPRGQHGAPRTARIGSCAAMGRPS